MRGGEEEEEARCFKSLSSHSLAERAEGARGRERERSSLRVILELFVLGVDDSRQAARRGYAERFFLLVSPRSLRAARRFSPLAGGREGGSGDARESLGEYPVHRASCISLHLHGCSRASII